MPVSPMRRTSSFLGPRSVPPCGRFPSSVELQDWNSSRAASALESAAPLTWRSAAANVLPLTAATATADPTWAFPSRRPVAPSRLAGGRERFRRTVCLAFRCAQAPLAVLPIAPRTLNPSARRSLAVSPSPFAGGVGAASGGAQGAQRRGGGGGAPASLDTAEVEPSGLRRRRLHRTTAPPVCACLCRSARPPPPPPRPSTCSSTWPQRHPPRPSPAASRRRPASSRSRPRRAPRRRPRRRRRRRRRRRARGRASRGRARPRRSRRWTLTRRRWRARWCK